ncbi:MAG: hypothetical protein WBV94_02440 [Blastocatellia bacterium]
MAGKISEDLKKRIEEFSKADPQQEIPVIITTKPNADPDKLKKKGLKIENTFENISAVSGTIPAAAIKELAQSDEIEIIEYDGEMWALPKAGGKAE